MTSPSVTLYHNPRCSKSRASLALLQARAIVPEIINYLEVPLAPAEIKTILTLMDVPVRAIMRTAEPIYQTLGLGAESCGEEELIVAIIDHPILLQRPIVVVNNEKAAIGRPPEAIVEILPATD